MMSWRCWWALAAAALHANAFSIPSTHRTRPLPRALGRQTARNTFNRHTGRRATALAASALDYGPGVVGDLAEIVELAQAEFGKAYGDPASKFGLRTLLAIGFFLRLTYGVDRDHRVICCRDGGGELVGVVELSMQPFGRLAGPVPPPQFVKRLLGGGEPLKPYLSNLLVAPPARQRGIGAALVRACEAEARRWDEDVVVLHHDTEDAKLDRFYKRLGYADEPAPTLPVDGFILKLVSKKILR